jgi:hypothetical protein
MISQAKAIKLVKIYLYICKRFEEDLQYVCERFSNNNIQELTDQEIMTIYLFAISEEQKFKVKQIHRFANEYLSSWFPNLKSYSAFSNRLNRLSEAFRLLTGSMLTEFQPSDCIVEQNLLDSMPIVTCSGKRSGKVAKELTDKTYCSTKNMWYYGLKLHVLGYRRISKLPFPNQICITQASTCDLNLFKESWSNIKNTIFFGDKIYCDKDFFSKLEMDKNSNMLTPVKGIKGYSDWDKNHDRAANDLFSKAVSTIRQPIEGLFSWLIEKTDLQRASKVRSSKGLMVHVFGKIAAAFILLIFNP